MSGFLSPPKWHDGLTPEELDHATATSGIDQGRNNGDRNRGRGACNAHVNAIRTTDANTTDANFSVERMISLPRQ